MKVPYNYIVVEGSIGAGKTTLSTMLARDFNAELVLERFADNPFLEKFYKDPEHYAFPVEMTFLMDRYQQLKNLLTARDLFTDFVIGDYFIDKCLLFSKNNLAKESRDNYKQALERHQKDLGYALREVAERQRAMSDFETTIQNATTSNQDYWAEVNQKAADLANLETQLKERQAQIKSEQKSAKSMQ